jgi:ABC-type Fe3+-citrate transport system substrate-binding protein
MGREVTRREILQWGAVGTVGLVAAACGIGPQKAAVSSGSSISLVHEAGTTVLQGPAKKLAVLQWQPAEALLALGLQPTLLADEMQAGSANPTPVQLQGKFHGYTSLGSRTAPNLEVLASTPVDLIVADINDHGKDYAAFSQIAPTILQDTNNWSKLVPNFDLIAQATGTTDKAAPTRTAFYGSVAAAEAKAKGTAPQRVVCAVVVSSGFFAYVSGSFQAAMLNALGAGYGFQGSATAGTTANISLDTVSALKADVLLLTAYPNQPLITDTWKTNPLWLSIPAVKNNRVHFVSRDLWSITRGITDAQQMISEAVTYLYS